MTKVECTNRDNGARTTSRKNDADVRSVSTTDPTEVIYVRSLVKALLHCHTREKSFYRDEILRHLECAVHQEDCIDAILTSCTAHGSPGRLDDAIDVLSRTKRLVLEYAWPLLKSDIKEWTKETDRAFRPSDDFWYILLRSIARTDADEKDRLYFVRHCFGASSRGIREGVVEALGDIGTQAAMSQLKFFAANDDDEYIRNISNEVLSDLVS